MVRIAAKSVAAISLLLSVPMAAPAWSAEKPAAHKASCPYAKHKHQKAKPVAAKPQSARGVMLVEHRKQDVQILSFGP